MGVSNEKATHLVEKMDNQNARNFIDTSLNEKQNSNEEKANKCTSTYASKEDTMKKVQPVYLKLKKYSCKICCSSFFSNKSLKRHVKSLHIACKEFKIQNTSRVSCDKANLKCRLSATHLRESVKKCDICKTEVYRDVDLVRHYENFHRIKKEKESETFQNNSDHETLIPEPIKPVLNLGQKEVCQICGEQFLHWNGLLAHMKFIHMNKKSPKILTLVVSVYEYVLLNRK